MASAIVAGALANKPHSGGEAWVRLSWVLGLSRLGLDVHYVEHFSGDEPACQYFEEVVAGFGLTERASLINHRGEARFGLCERELGNLAEDADLLFNLSGHLKEGPIFEGPRKRVYVDLDPGFTQVWHADDSIEFSVAGHDHHLTVGQNIGKSGCPIPTGGIEWIPIFPPVLLDAWEPTPAPSHPLTFTTVATWRSSYGGLEIGGRTMGLKHHQFRRFAELPERVEGAELEIALDIHPGDSADLELLSEHGWKIVDPRAAATPAMFRDYVRCSAGEFSVAQGVYVEALTGWFSDRTAAYLATGRPAVVQDTGLSLTGTGGVMVFHDLDTAISGIEAVVASYAEHADAARDFARERLDSDRVLGRILNLLEGG